ncbi:MAG: TIM23 complex component [Alyxoria varia]|nr:MAG: TIM23 complex component [Alyxoria varia]
MRCTVAVASPIRPAVITPKLRHTLHALQTPSLRVSCATSTKQKLPPKEVGKVQARCASYWANPAIHLSASARGTCPRGRDSQNKPQCTGTADTARTSVTKSFLFGRYSSTATSAPAGTTAQQQRKQTSRNLQDPGTESSAATPELNVNEAEHTLPHPSHPPPKNPQTQEQQSPSPQTALTWNDFFALRRRRRIFNLSGSVISAAGATISSTLIISSQPLDALQPFGVDPLIGAGLMVFLSGGIGWLCGPLLGSGAFRLGKSKQVLRSIVEKEKDFYGRIKRFRIDPSGSSVQNPVPDFYGEKIGSVDGYRRWLKDQRAFNRKRSRFL